MRCVDCSDSILSIGIADNPIWPSKVPSKSYEYLRPTVTFIVTFLTCFRIVMDICEFWCPKNLSDVIPRYNTAHVSKTWVRSTIQRAIRSRVSLVSTWMFVPSKFAPKRCVNFSRASRSLQFRLNFVVCCIFHISRRMLRFDCPIIAVKIFEFFFDTCAPADGTWCM